ncbi:MAG: hypothetical protein AB8G95_23995 [Anaerolineae bacterium]
MLLNTLFPKTITNVFPGRRIALYLFYGLTAFTLFRALLHLLSQDGGAQSVATIPLDNYSAGAAATLIGIFSLWGMSQLVIGLIYLIASLRYKAMIPLIYALLVVENLGNLFYYYTKPIETAGAAPGDLTYWVFILLGLIMLGLCLIPARQSKPN